MLPHPSLQLFPTNAIYDQPVATCTLEIRHSCSSSPQATGSPCDALLPYELQGTPRRRGRCLHASPVTAFSNQRMKPCQYRGKIYLLRKDMVPHSRFLATSAFIFCIGHGLVLKTIYKDSRHPRLTALQCIWCIVFWVTGMCSLLPLIQFN